MGRLLTLVSITLLLGIIVAGWTVGPGMEQRIVPGIWVWDIPLGGMTQNDAATQLQNQLPLQQPNIILVGPDGKRWAFSPAQLGMNVDVHATLAQAYALGHDNQAGNKLLERLKIMTSGISLAPILAWDTQQAVTQLQQVATEIDRNSQNAQVHFAGTELQLEQGDIGRRMEVSATLEALRPALYNLEATEIVPAITELPPQITDEEASRAIGIANTILGDTLTILMAAPREGDPGPWRIPAEVMVGMLAVRIEEHAIWVGLDEAALAEFLSPIAMALYREPQNATFQFEPTTLSLSPITPSSIGREVDVSASILRINEMLQNGEHFVPLITRETPPTLPETVTAEELGIREVVAVGESYFSGSSSGRDKNIRLGASKFKGVLVAPGDTFSFNEFLGDVTPEAGYDESYVIIGNRTVLGVGGGICQVATTAFRAAFFGGYPIVERWPHAYRVGYYELGGFGPGFDATIYSPLVDFRFTNDTESYILVQTEIDTAQSRLRFLFYSTDTGRSVEQIGPTWGASIPPENPIYEYDPDLPAGSYSLVERAHDGLNASLSRVVRDAAGELLYEDTFTSNFIPWPARYHYGPDFVPPPSAEVVTPEP